MSLPKLLSRATRPSLAAALALALPLVAGAASPPRSPAPTAPPPPPAPRAFPDRSGSWANFPGGQPDQTNPFFVPLGANGRTCATCHAPTDAWTATPGELQKRFTATAGADPVFLSIDGTNCPTLPVNTPVTHQAASSLLLGRGLIRVELTPPAAADFRVSAVANPYGCSSTSTVSVYRRILPTSNLAFLSTVMWDGRETGGAASIYADLTSQANDAIKTHAVATHSVPPATVAALVGLELGQFTAQTTDLLAGPLSAAGASGGVVGLSQQAFTPGENAGQLTPTVFTTFAAWEAIVAPAGATGQAQASIGRGERLFNTRPMTITRVAGLNDVAPAGGPPRAVIVGTCGTCHNATNAGSNSAGLLVDEGQARRPASDLPLITLVSKTTGAVVQVSDPGAALTTGRFADIGKFKVPTLRGLAARPPYFHDGSARTLDEVVAFYNARFNLNLSAREHADLVAFLGAL
jgi:cytochrome c peroxidase